MNLEPFRDPLQRSLLALLRARSIKQAEDERIAALPIVYSETDAPTYWETDPVAAWLARPAKERKALALETKAKIAASQRARAEVLALGDIPPVTRRVLEA